nr:DUF805 domain-containing protein [Stagnihabitans tardus]
MGPAQVIRTGFAKSFDCTGRASRLEFWTFALFCLVVQRYLSEAEFLLWNAGWIREADLALPTLAWLHGLSIASNAVQQFLTVPLGYFPESGVLRGSWMGNWTFLSSPSGQLGLPVFLALALPTISLALRRARDAGWPPFAVLLAWTWPQLLLLISNGLVLVGGLLGAQSLASLWTESVIGPFFTQIAPRASEASALFAVYVFASAPVAGSDLVLSEAFK